MPLVDILRVPTKVSFVMIIEFALNVGSAGLCPALEWLTIAVA